MTMVPPRLSSLLLLVAMTMPQFLEAQLTFEKTKEVVKPSETGGQKKVTSEDTKKKFFPGVPPLTTGNEAVDGGIVGTGVGILAGAALTPVIQDVLGGGNSGCGRRKRQATEEEELRFFLPSGNQCTCGYGKRKRRDAPGEDDLGVRFLNLANLFGGNSNNLPYCGNCCNYYSNNNNFQNNQNNNFHNNQNNNFHNNQNNNNNFHNNQNNNNNFHHHHNTNNPSFSHSHNHGSRPHSHGSSKPCRCHRAITYTDRYGISRGACKPTGTSEKRWCYTTGWGNTGCGDLKTSSHYPNNPWSYNACSSSSRNN